MQYDHMTFCSLRENWRSVYSRKMGNQFSQISQFQMGVASGVKWALDYKITPFNWISKFSLSVGTMVRSDFTTISLSLRFSKTKWYYVILQKLRSNLFWENWTPIFLESHNVKGSYCKISNGLRTWNYTISVRVNIIAQGVHNGSKLFALQF